MLNKSFTPIVSRSHSSADQNTRAVGKSVLLVNRYFLIDY